MPNTISLNGRPRRMERLAGATITPGYLCALQSDNTVDPHGTAASNAIALFAAENEVFGQEITDDYASGDNVLMWMCKPGDEIYALVAASASAIVTGQYLESAGDGTLRLATADAATDTAQREAIVAIALEDVDNSGGGAEARIRVMVV